MPALPIVYERRLENRYQHYIYRLVDERGRAWYVGITNVPKRRSLTHGRLSNKSKISCAMRKRGIHKFKMVIYGGSNSSERIVDREMEGMLHYKTFRPIWHNSPTAWNLRPSGAHCIYRMTEAQRKRFGAAISAARKRGEAEKRRKGLPPSGTRPLRFANRNFKSRTEAANWAKVPPPTLSRWLSEGRTERRRLRASRSSGAAGNIIPWSRPPRRLATPST